MRRTAFSIALAAEMFVVAGTAHAQPPAHQPDHNPSKQPADARPASRPEKSDPAEREKMEKEWKELKKDWEKLSAEQQVLSAIRAKNREEIEAGRIAAARGTSQAVKDFAAMMMRDHTEADSKLSSLASSENITLWDTTRTDRALFLKMMFEKHKDKDKDDKRDKKDKDKDNEKGKDKDRDHHDDPAHWNESVRQMHENPLAWLNAQPADQFDRIYGHMMSKGHGDLLKFLEKSQGDLKNEHVKTYVSDVMSTVRKHKEEAAKLPGAGDDIKREDTKISPPGNNPDASNPHRDR